MDTVQHQKVHIERAIERARDGVGDRIDELDRRIRRQLDFKSMASEHAEQLAIGGAAFGFFLGFGFPKALSTVLKVGIPVALIAYKVKQARDSAAA